MVNQSVNEFYSRFLFKTDSLPQEILFPLDIDATFFNNLSPGVRELFISEGFQVPPISPTETNHQENWRLLLVRTAAVEAEKNTITIKDAMQPDIRSRHPRIFMGMFGVNLSTQMNVLGIIFQYEE